MIEVNFLLLTLIGSFLQPSLASTVCSNHEMCQTCISWSSSCAWCTDPIYTDARCGTQEDLISNGCRQEFIEHPTTDSTVVRNESLSKTKLASKGEAVQIQPQRMFLRLRKKDPIKLTLSYKQAVDYPVDLYYLMDLSRTMLKNKNTLASLGNKLADEMDLITKNFRLGFGSFIDKTILPFTDTKRLDKPCEDCSRVYGYRNHMSLSINTSKFSHEVEESKTSGNIDGPEGGFDAIMQSIVCKDIIGWRRDARKLLIFTTDADFHSAGDGRLAGILEPNDETCHIDEKGFYDQSEKQDYPSISQINTVSQQNNVHIVFAIVGNRIRSYQNLLGRIKSSSVVELTSDSSNIVNLVRTEYEKLLSNLQLSDNSSEHLKISYYSSCLSGQRKQTNLCLGFTVDDQINFDIEVELLSCPQKMEKYREIIRIAPMGLNEGLILEVEMLCSCDCQEESRKEIISPRCNRRGSYECGICVCNPDSYGQKCECSSEDLNTIKSDENCRTINNRNETTICSGRGHCICGKCSCFETRGHNFTGKHCGCDNADCEMFEGSLCGGPQRGRCRCGSCECNANWSGENCGCSLDRTPCTDPMTQKVCNGRGKCVCGSCQCDSHDYSGPYCDECPTCPEQCPVLSKLVEQQIRSNITKMVNNSIESYLMDDLKIFTKGKTCRFIGQDDCAYVFKYRRAKENRKNSSIIIEASRKGQCKELKDIGAYSVRYIGGFVIIGLFTMILWRIGTFFIDRHEYDKFIKSCKSVKFPENQNPLFKPSTSRFTNPVYSD